MQFGCRMVMIAVAASAAGADGGGKHRTLAATPPAAAAIPIQPPQERKARPDDDLPPELVIRGKVVDIETGRPITHFFLQQGEPDPDDPSRTNWNAGESWSSENPGGSLDQSYTEKGEWWRVVAPGYVPQPLTEKPYDGRPGIVNVTVKLRRGWRIAGLVVDPSRKPVAGASVFLVGGRMMEPNITGGKAWERSSNFMRSEDKNVTKAVTDGDGRFVLDAAGGYETAIAVSSAALDLWIHQPVPALGKSCEIVLPAPCKLVVRYRIEGAEPDAIVTLFSQHDLWNVAVNERELKVPNGGQIAIENLMPGRYRVQRQKTVRVGNARQSPRLETLSVAVEAGKSGVAAIVRESGAAVEGEILGLEQLKLPGALIYIVKPESLQLIVLNNHVREAVEALTCDATGRFKTPRLSPGDYAIVVEGYKPPTPDERLGSARRATYRAIGKLTVPAQGPAPRVRIRVPASLAGDGPDNAL